MVLVLVQTVATSFFLLEYGSYRFLVEVKHLTLSPNTAITTGKGFIQTQPRGKEARSEAEEGGKEGRT